MMTFAAMAEDFRKRLPFGSKKELGGSTGL